MIKRSTLEISTYAASLRPSFTSFCGTCQLFISYFHSQVYTYQCLHCPMQRMPMIPPELGVGAFERRVAVGLWPLDPAAYSSYQHPSPQGPLIPIVNPSRKPQNQVERITYPLRCAFLLWLCCDEFFDSIKKGVSNSLLTRSKGRELEQTHWPWQRCCV